MENVQIENSDLDVQLNIGFVCVGKMRDIIKLRNVILNTENVRTIFNTLASEKLYVIKQSKLSAEQIEVFNNLAINNGTVKSQPTKLNKTNK